MGQAQFLFEARTASGRVVRSSRARVPASPCSQMPRMFTDMFNAMEAGRAPRETLPDGRVKLILKDPTTGVCSDRLI